MIRRLYMMGYYRWYYTALGRRRYSNEHALVKLEDGGVIKLCDRHRLNKEQLEHTVPASGGKRCQKCSMIVRALCQESRSLNEFLTKGVSSK